MKKLIINFGDVFNDLIIIKEVNKIKNDRRFVCECRCGNTIVATLSHLLVK